MMKAAREHFRYTLAGGWAATITDALVHRCQKCGAYTVTLSRQSQLQRAIARAVVNKGYRLAPEEITFLRIHLGLSGRDLARTLGVTSAALSRWENGKDPIGPVSDRLLKALLALLDLGVDALSREAIAAIEDGDGQPMRITLRSDDGEWTVGAAA